MNELSWIAEARSLIGLREIAPNKHPKLTAWQIDLGAAWLGAVPWCGVFAAHCTKVGGNQGDSVCIKPFSVVRVSSYRWLGVAPLPERYNLPTLNSDGKVSQNEG